MGDNQTYGEHPSEVLSKLFKDKPYQGQNPLKAKVIILGIDANYHPNISDHSFFDRVLEYHDDGVYFWKEHNVHHPFLLKEFPFNKNSNGVPYHKAFSKLGFTAEHAKLISFVELLNIPTTGNMGSNKELFRNLLDGEHLKWVDEIIRNKHGKNKKFVLINQTLAKELRYINRKYGCFDWLVDPVAKSKPSTIALQNDNVIIFNGYNFAYAFPGQYLKRLRDKIYNVCKI